ncbi:RAxF-45 family protein [Peribacillus kribbensis]|nr:RAxF-45 family protein [Peribacillus kribbensis]
MKRFIPMREQYLEFIYIVCAIFHVQFSKGEVCPFLRIAYGNKT